LILVTHDRNLIHPVDHVFDMRAGSLGSLLSVTVIPSSDSIVIVSSIFSEDS
jgi:hypothetical protein